MLFYCFFNFKLIDNFGNIAEEIIKELEEIKKIQEEKKESGKKETGDKEKANE